MKKLFVILSACLAVVMADAQDRRQMAASIMPTLMPTRQKTLVTLLLMATHHFT